MTVTPPAAESMTLDLVGGFIGLMVRAGIGTWDDTGNGLYKAGDMGIVIGTMPQTPADLISVTPYVAQVDVEPDVDVRAIQVRIRTGSRDPRPAIGIVDRLHDTLNGLGPVTLGGWNVPLIWRNSLMDLGLDTSDRYEITDNYYLYVDKEPHHG
ncbi:minor capsid protein [Galactobacter sp.]|mgnify:CR=1 FL=1|uniref:minor capsid protein n=1 Tax=Galactobacter sp. TaxID=2676125 RepID=UPI0025C66B98|nr:minor capsid protein [Galactobacter sp.]